MGQAPWYLLLQASLPLSWLTTSTGQDPWFCGRPIKIDKDYRILTQHSLETICSKGNVQFTTSRFASVQSR